MSRAKGELGQLPVNITRSVFRAQRPRVTGNEGSLGELHTPFAPVSALRAVGQPFRRQHRFAVWFVVFPAAESEGH